MVQKTLLTRNGDNMKLEWKDSTDMWIVSDTFKYVDTHGLPLPVLMDVCLKENLLISPLQFILEATNHGWKLSTTLSRLDEAYVDVFGKEYRDKVFSILNQLDLTKLPYLDLLSYNKIIKENIT